MLRSLQISGKIHCGENETSPFSLCGKLVTSSAKSDARNDRGSCDLLVSKDGISTRGLHTKRIVVAVKAIRFRPCRTASFEYPIAILFCSSPSVACT